MSQVGLTESVRGNKGDIRKFEVWLQGRQEVHTILAPSAEVKETWVKEIKRVLLDQFEYLKGENIKQYSSRIQKGASLNGIRIPPLSPTTQHRSGSCCLGIAVFLELSEFLCYHVTFVDLFYILIYYIVYFLCSLS